MICLECAFPIEEYIIDDQKCTMPLIYKQKSSCGRYNNLITNAEASIWIKE